MENTAQKTDSANGSPKTSGGHFGMIIFCLLGFGVSAWSSFSALVTNYLKGSLDYLIATAVVTTGATLFGLAFFNILVTRIANQINRKYAEQSEKINGKKMGEIPSSHPDSRFLLGCSYCGAEEKRLVCGSCDSILWYKIKSLPEKAAFFAAHRRNVANGLLISAFLVTPLTFLYQLMDKRIEAYNFYEQKSLEAREALNRARGLLVSLENLDFAYGYDVSELLQKRIELLDEFQHNYKKASWMAPQVVSYFGWDHNAEKHRPFGIYRFVSSIMKMLTREGESKFDLEDVWKKMDTKWVDEKGNHLDFFKMLDTDFQAYIKASNDYYQGAFGDTVGNDQLDHLKNERCDAAKLFYKKGQLAGCLLFHLSFDNNRTNVSENKDLDFFGCSSYFKKYEDWDGVMSSCETGCFDKKIIEEVNATGMFTCWYGTTKAEPKPPAHEPKTKPQKKKKARYEVIAGCFENERWADQRMAALKAIGYHPSKHWDTDKRMYRVVGLKTDKAFKAYTARHVFEKEHGFEAWVRDNNKPEHSTGNAFASSN